MICKQNEAKVHLTQIMGDKMQKVDLCEECAKTKGVNDPAGFSLADLLLGLGASQEIAQSIGGDEVKCPRCGFTQGDFKKTGRFGCAECYVAFGEGLENMLRAMHKDVKHIGKAPLAMKQNRNLTERMKSLQKKLEKAIAVEDFEQAAKMRDEIKELKAQIDHVTAS